MQVYWICVNNKLIRMNITDEFIHNSEWLKKNEAKLPMMIIASDAFTLLTQISWYHKFHRVVVMVLLLYDIIASWK